MDSRTPVERQTSWLLAVPQFVVLAVLIAIFWIPYGSASLLYASLLYLGYSYGSRWILLSHHRQGRMLTDQGDYEAAVNQFLKSYEFFSKYPWLDRYRYLTMMTPGQPSFREMALINMAYGYVQLGRKEEAKANYQRLLQEFPDSSVTQRVLDYIQAIEEQGS